MGQVVTTWVLALSVFGCCAEPIESENSDAGIRSCEVSYQACREKYYSEHPESFATFGAVLCELGYKSCKGVDGGES